MLRRLAARSTDLLLTPAAVLSACLAAFAVLLISEDDLASAAFAALGVTLTGAFVHLLSRRPAFSVYAALTLAAIVVLPSAAKARLTGMSLHSYDLAFLADPDMPVFFVTGYPAYAIPVLALFGLALLVLFLIFVREPARRIGAPRHIAAVAAPALLLPAALPDWADGDDYHFHGRHASAFAASFRDLPNLWAEHPLAARLKETSAVAPYPEAFACGPARPDIVLVHGESQLPPSWLVDGTAPELTASFRSHDGSVHRMGVETFGGGSWITVASIMSGLSGADFGWMRQFIAKSLTGNVAASVPEILAACGYETTGMLGMGYDQFDLGPFLTSAGMAEVHDHATTGIPSLFVRDSRYFEAMWDLTRRKRSETGAPQFLYVETMSTHSPYDARLDPEMTLDEEPYSAEPEANEFFRRLAIARGDLDAFKAAITRDPGPRGTILVEYGDHRPMVELVSGSRPDLSDWGSEAYETYFAATAFGDAVPPAMPGHPRMDAAFLGYWLLDAAGIAQGGLIGDMADLRRRCDGLYHLCADREAVDRVLRRRVDSGLLALPPLLGAWAVAAPRDPVRGEATAASLH